MKNNHFFKIFFDTEFTELTQNAKLLSIALVAETGEQFYAECTDYQEKDINEWVRENVINKFTLTKTNLSDIRNIEIKDNRESIANNIRLWLQQFEIKNPNAQFQFWGDCPAWDWVLFCELFGGSFKRPENIHYMCMDLATLFHIKGYLPDYSRIQLLKDNDKVLEGDTHNALYDTLVCKKCYEILIKK
ncbi:MAG: 3'-5' exoribonuclease [Chitinophagales bacterium]|nr:3'-5' exoribonuclease [Chitinophagales bacterium]